MPGCRRIITSGFGLPKPGGVPGGDINPHRATPGLGGRKPARLRFLFEVRDERAGNDQGGPERHERGRRVSSRPLVPATY
jgi:hypothetical protein